MRTVIATSASAPSPQFTTYTSGSKLELGFLNALRRDGDIGTL